MRRDALDCDGQLAKTASNVGLEGLQRLADEEAQVGKTGWGK